MRHLRQLIPFLLAAASLPATAGVRLSAPTYSGLEGTPVTVKAVLTNKDSESAPVTVNYSTVAGTASESTDYSQSSGTLVWELGDFAEKTITIPLLSDGIAEGTENFTVVLSDSSGTSLASPSTAKVDILDAESASPGSIEFAATSIGLAEGTSGNCNSPSSRDVSVTVRRVGGANGPVSAEYTFISGGTATPLRDFTSTNGTLNWANGDSADKTFTFKVVEDCMVESDETVLFQLQNPVNATLGSARQTTATIVDDDQVNAPGLLEFTTNAVSVDEEVGQVVLDVRRVGGTTGAVSVRYSTSFGTASSNDLTAQTGLLQWADGDASTRQISVPITADSLAESDETFSLVLSGASGASIGANSQVTVTIRDNDPPSATYAFEVSNTNVVDDNDAVLVHVIRTGTGASIASAGSVTVTSKDISATAPSDYTAVNQVISWASGESGSKDLLVPINRTSDPSDAATERFGLSLSGAVAGQLGSPSTTTVTIQTRASSTSPSTLTLELNHYVVGAENLVVRVLRTTGSAGSASVHFQTVNGSAKAGTDFTSTSQDLTWGDGDTSPREVVVPILSSGSPTGAKSFTVQLVSPSNASLGTSTANVDLKAVLATPIRFEVATDSVFDDRGVYSIKVFRDGTQGAASVSISAVSGTAVAGTDFVDPGSTVLNWSDGDNSPQVVIVTLLNTSTTIQSDKQFSLLFSDATGTATYGSPSSVRVSIKSAYTEDAKGAAGCSWRPGQTGSDMGLVILLALASLGLMRRRRAR